MVSEVGVHSGKSETADEVILRCHQYECKTGPSVDPSRCADKNTSKHQNMRRSKRKRREAREITRYI